jgi:hypothetical protein
VSGQHVPFENNDRPQRRWIPDRHDAVFGHAGHPRTVSGKGNRCYPMPVGGALELNGSTFLVFDLAPNPQEGPFTALAWVKGGASGQAILSQQSGVNWLMADSATGVLRTEVSQTTRAGLGLSSSAVITDGDWHRVALVWDGTNRRLYVDGVLAAEDTQKALAPGYGKLVIGAGSNLTAGSFWSGLIDDVRIYNQAVKP